MPALVHQTRTPTGQTVYHLEADAGCIEHLIFRGVFPVLFSTLAVMVMFGTVARIHPLVGLCAVSVVPALYVAVKAYIQQLAQRAARVKLIESVMGAPRRLGRRGLRGGPGRVRARVHRTAMTRKWRRRAQCSRADSGSG
jgi:hypothetical protein